MTSALAHATRRTLSIAAITVLSMLALPIASRAQVAVTQAALEAAFIYNFARFVEWPPESVREGPFTMCILGDEDLAVALEDAVRQRSVAGHEVIVVRVNQQRLPACNLLYLAGLTPVESRQITDRLTGTPTLTVSSRARFAETGGIIGLFLDQGHMRFAINVNTAERCHVRLSSRLLSLAKLVKNDDEQ